MTSKGERSTGRPPPPTLKMEQLVCKCIKLSCNDIHGEGTCSVCKKQGAMIVEENGICICVICKCECHKSYKVRKSNYYVYYCYYNGDRSTSNDSDTDDRTIICTATITTDDRSTTDDLFYR